MKGAGLRGVAVFQVGVLLVAIFGFALVSGASENVVESEKDSSRQQLAQNVPSLLLTASSFSGGFQDLPLEVGYGADIVPASAGSGDALDAALNDALGDVDKAEDALKANLKNQAAGENADSWLSNFLGTGQGTWQSGLATGLQWATVAYAAGYAIGSLVGMSEDNTQALSTSLAAGFGSYGYLTKYAVNAESGSIFADGGTFNWVTTGSNPALVSMGIGVVIFALMYKDTEVKIVTFECLPWQAPNGGNKCEACNDEDLPCSEYRCRSLGANCELVNAGSEEEKCVNVNPKDVVPPVITPSEKDLTSGLEYQNVKTSPPGPGFEIIDTKNSEGCLPAFTSLSFGLTLDEPGQCKIDFDSTASYEDMRYYFGGRNLYLYNHTEIFLLPGAEDIDGSSGLVLQNGQDLEFYLRCQDKNGNSNEAEYAVKLCVDPTPDSTAPRIEATSITNGGCVAEDKDNAEVIFYTNEPADCKWDFDDKSYDEMNYGMTCSNKLWQINAAQLYECVANLTGISRDGEDYYVRCKDQPTKEEADRNSNSESFKFSLAGSTGLVLRELLPNETLFSGVSPASIELYVETSFGCDNGQSVCYYSNDGNNYIQFFDTDNADGISTQSLNLVDGDYQYYVRCVDGGGNIVENVTDFEIDVDTNAPVIARAYEESGKLKIVTVRDSECSYTNEDCNFAFDEGTEMPYANSTFHVAEWDKSQTYYIKCRDEFRNEDADCSLVVRPSTNFL